jgi:hypothetical protein
MMPDKRDHIPSLAPSDDEPDVSASPPTSRGHGASFDGPPHTPARSLLVHFGRWRGEDIEELLDEVYRTRGKVRF